MFFFNRSSCDMFEVEDKSINLIITSPPYPLIKKWDEMLGLPCEKAIDNFKYQHSALDGTWRECWRVMSDGGIMCVNIGDATRTVNEGFHCFPNYARITMAIFDIGFTPLVPILWKKISNRPNAFLGSGFIPPNGYISQDCEYIALFRKNQLRKFPPKDENRYNSSFTKDERDLWFRQIWDIKGARGAKDSSAFPDEVPYRLMRMFSVKYDLVLDPFCGTGTVMRVADENDRIGIGYDITDQISDKEK